nr:hypothetical protein PNEFENPC_00082 [Escherichia coli]
MIFSVEGQEKMCINVKYLSAFHRRGIFPQGLTLKDHSV